MAFSSSLDDGRSGTEEGVSVGGQGKISGSGSADMPELAELVQICRTGSAYSAQSHNRRRKIFCGGEILFWDNRFLTGSTLHLWNRADCLLYHKD